MRSVAFMCAAASIAVFRLGSLAQADEAEDLSDSAVASALARYQSEPKAYEVVAAALRAASVDPALAYDAASRARAAGWAPTLRLEGRRGQGRDLTGQVTTLDDARLSTDDQLSLDLALTFDLGRLVYAADEVRLLREAREQQDWQRAFVRDIVRIYYERRRLQLERDLLASDDIDHAVRIAEAEALLDVFTRGAFGRMMARDGRLP